MIIVKIMGGLGNQFFQYAAGRNFALRNNFPLKLDLTFFREERYKDIFRLDHYNTIYEEAKEDEISGLLSIESSSVFAITSRKFNIHNKYNKKSHISEKLGGNADRRIIKSREDAYIVGWWQNEEYFRNIRPLLLKELTLRVESDPFNIKTLEEIKNCESVSLHIRRGDYVTNSYFGTLPIEYYKKAIDYIKRIISSPVYYVFSDDLDWVKKNLVISGNVYYLERNSIKNSIYHTQKDYEDLNLMIHCKHNVIANSSLSWWSGWLNNNNDKIVIAPAKWYNDSKAQKFYERGLLRVKEWILI
jgi:hypothetical protein